MLHAKIVSARHKYLKVQWNLPFRIVGLVVNVDIGRERPPKLVGSGLA